MDVNVLQEYLVSLGWKIDQPGLQKFQDALRKATELVERATVGTPFGMASMFVKAGAVITGVLAGIASGVVGVANSVAQGDMDMQLFARRMFMGTDAARQLKYATDALGYSLEEIVWGPKELQERFRELISVEKEMTQRLGPDFEIQARRIRDIRFEFTKLDVELKFFAMTLTRDLSKALFGDENAILTRLQNWNRWFIENMPRLSQELAGHLAPIMRDVGEVLQHIGHMLEVAATAAMRFIGILSDDKQLKNGALTIDNIGRSIEHVASALAQTFAKLDAIASWFDAHPNLARALLGAAVGGLVGGPEGAGVGAVAGLLSGPMEEGGNKIGAFTNTDEQKIQMWKKAWGSVASAATGATTSIADQARKIAGTISKRTGIPAEIIFGQFVHETGNFTNRGAKELHNLAGINVPGGGGQDYRNFGSFEEFSNYFSQLLTGSRYAGALNTHTADSYAAALKRGGYYTGPEGDYAKGIQRGEASYNVGGVTVNITQPHATAEEVKRATLHALDEKMGRENQREMLQTPAVVY